MASPATGFPTVSPVTGAPSAAPVTGAPVGLLKRNGKQFCNPCRAQPRQCSECCEAKTRDHFSKTEWDKDLDLPHTCLSCSEVLQANTVTCSFIPDSAISASPTVPPVSVASAPAVPGAQTMSPRKEINTSSSTLASSAQCVSVALAPRDTQLLAAASSATESSPSIDCATGLGHALVGKRVAQEFEEGLFFGSIQDYYPVGSIENIEIEMWRVEYEDGDAADCDFVTLQAMFALYNMEKDKGHGGIGMNSNCYEVQLDYCDV